MEWSELTKLTASMNHYQALWIKRDTEVFERHLLWFALLRSTLAPLRGFRGKRIDVHLQDLTDIDFSLIPRLIINLLRLNCEESSRCQDPDITCALGGICHGNMNDSRSLLFICYNEVDLKSTYDSRSVIFFDIITENVETCIC